MNGAVKIALKGKEVVIMGGPYKDKPDGVVGVNLRNEAPAECDLYLPIQDFSVPDKAALSNAVGWIISKLHEKGEVYIGCAGGFGRTGLVIGAVMKEIARRELASRSGFKGAIRHWLNKVFNPEYEYNSDEDLRVTIDHTILVVRDTYHPHAVETKQQQDLLDEV